MSNKSILNQFSRISFLALLSTKAFSAPGILEDVPLNISTSIQPNILFLLDDSGSMDWEQLISDSGQDAYGVGPNGRSDDLVNPPTNDTHVNELCLQYNLMAYNPEVEYLPWSGVDSDGNAFDDKTLTTALANPNNPSPTRNLTDHIYTTWVDDNNNDTFDWGECGTYSGIFSAAVTPGGHNVYTMGTDSGSSDDVGYLVDSGGTTGFYSNNETHGFLISIPAATSITLTFSQFNVENNYDFLRIYQGSSTAGSLQATLDGDSIPGPITITGNDVYLEFDTDYSVTEDGFVMFWNHAGSGVSTPGFDASDGCTADDHCTLVSSLPTNATAAAGVINTQENYANWYTYYRKREYVAKKALSDIISDSNSRLGLATLHNRGGAGTIIEDMRVPARKDELLENLFDNYSSGGTPLRTNLEQVGDYFEENTSVDSSLFGFTPDHSGDGTVSTTSPILNAANGGTCQQNFSVVFSDGFWNGGSPYVGDQDSDTANDYDGGWFADSYLGAFSGGIGNTLADVAMLYLKNDLAPSLPNSANIVDIRDSSPTPRRIDHQHLTTYTVAFGLRGTMDVNPSDPSFLGWTDPINNGGDERIDDMRHAAWNGRGEFLTASDPQELIASLNDAIDDIADRTGTATAASFSSGLIETDTLVFQSRFSTDSWTGDLLAFRFDENGIVDTDSNSMTDENDAIWSAATALTSMVEGSGGSGYLTRNIITFNGTQGVPFEFPTDYTALDSSTLSATQVADLLNDAPFSATTTDAGEIADNQQYGEQIVAYLMGDRANEIGVSGGDSLFRARNHEYLSAIIHSSPQYLGPPGDKYPDALEGSSNLYSNFVSANSSRVPLVFVGGNNGMLHAFDGSTGTSGGEEVFAYVPGNLENELHTLAEADYSHLAYVDATPTIRDVFVSGSWRTYLIGGLRSGGRGIFVLDVTSPTTLQDTSNADTIVRHELTDVDLGFTYSRPQIARMNNGRWAAIFGNGYNSEGDGRAKLFILFLDNFSLLKLDTGEGTLVNGSCEDVLSDCNGLSSPTIADLNGDFKTDRIYAGDVHGNMWVFNVSDTSSSNWHVAFAGEPLFQACSTSPCTTASRQPITTKPSIVRHPGRRSASTSPNVLVYFGTGQYIAQDDHTNNDLQSFYAVWDAGSSITGSTYGDLDRSDLTAQEFSYDTATNTIGATQYPVAYVEGGTGSNFGWHIDLEVPTNNLFDGGRITINPLIINQFVAFVVTVPGGEVCDREGTSYLVVLGALQGQSSDDFPVATEYEDPIVGIELLNIDGQPVITTTTFEGDIDPGMSPPGRGVVEGRKSWSILK